MKPIGVEPGTFKGWAAMTTLRFDARSRPGDRGMPASRRASGISLLCRPEATLTVRIRPRQRCDQHSACRISGPMESVVKGAFWAGVYDQHSSLEEWRSPLGPRVFGAETISSTQGLYRPVGQVPKHVPGLCLLEGVGVESSMAD